MIFERYFQPPLSELLALMKDKYLRLDYHYLLWLPSEARGDGAKMVEEIFFR
jgi:hypothetical protein